jgi:hypothetical protein
MNDPQTKIMFILSIVTTIGVIIILGILGFIVLKKIDLILANLELIKSQFIGMNASVI